MVWRIQLGSDAYNTETLVVIWVAKKCGWRASVAGVRVGTIHMDLYRSDRHNGGSMTMCHHLLSRW